MKSGQAAVALCCGALVLLPGCGSGGSGGKIPRSDGDRLQSAITAADQYSADGKCGRAHTKVSDARYLLGRLPTSVDKGVRQGIADGLSRLDSLITSECAQPTKTQTTPTQTQTTTTTTTTTTTPSTTTPSTTTPSTTTPSTTTPSTTTPTTTAPTGTGTGTSTSPSNGGTPTGTGATGTSGGFGGTGGGFGGGGQ